MAASRSHGLRVPTWPAGVVDSVMVTVDADVVSSAFAPGVSAPQPLGLDPETVVRLLKHLLSRGGTGCQHRSHPGVDTTGSRRP